MIYRQGLLRKVSLENLLMQKQRRMVVNPGRFEKWKWRFVEQRDMWLHIRVANPDSHEMEIVAHDSILEGKRGQEEIE